MSKFYAVRKGRNPGVYSTWSDCEKNVKGFAGAEYKSFPTEQDAQSYMTAKNETVENKTANVNSQSTLTSVKSINDFDEMSAKAHEYLDYLSENCLILPDLYEKACQQVDMSIRAQKQYSSVMANRQNKAFPDKVNIYVDGSYKADTNEYGYGVYIDDGERRQILCGKGVCKEGGRNVEGEVEAARVAIDFIRTNPYYQNVTLYHDYQGIGSWADGDWSANKLYTKRYAKFVKDCREEGLNITFEHVNGHTGVIGNEYVDKLAKMGCGIALTASEESFISALKNVPGFPNTKPLPDLNIDDRDSLCCLQDCEV